jgi:phosphoribosylformylglycinamidine synthase I
MSSINPKILILTGDGINCERETARAFNLAKADTKILHINDLLLQPQLFKDYQALALPGGFSFGDDLGSGQILGLKLGRGLAEELRAFVAAGKPIIGICNGFQALAKLGLLPMPFERRVMAIGGNAQGHFIDRWVDLESDPKSPCIWTKGLNESDDLSMPIRHGEGRIVFLSEEEEIIHNQLTRDGQIPLRYRQNVNGSYGRIAGICDPKGLVFGLMPHPEAAISILQHPRSTGFAMRTANGVGLKLFENCVKYLREN